MPRPKKSDKQKKDNVVLDLQQVRLVCIAISLHLNLSDCKYQKICANRVTFNKKNKLFRTEKNFFELLRSLLKYIGFCELGIASCQCIYIGHCYTCWRDVLEPMLGEK